MPSISRKFFQNSMLRWYARYGRDLPWRHTDDPYKIWISEIMLQQTQVERVKEYYARFFKKFPTVRHLAKASWDEVLEAWRGLGYYRRARNLHEAARVVVKNYGGKFPHTYEELQKLPGIGSYTAAAIASFAFGEDVPALDTNLHKVFRHVFGEKFWKSMNPREQFHFAKSYIPKGKGAVFNHALMDLGASGMSPCTFQPHCAEKNISSSRPQARLQKKSYDFKVAVGVLIRNGKILISKRRKNDSLGGYWEFPGGKVENGEDERACLKREMQEELGIEVAVRPAFHKVRAELYGRKFLVSFHRCSLLLGEPQARHVETFKWATLPELPRHKFPPRNYEVINILQKKKGMLRYS